MELVKKNVSHKFTTNILLNTTGKNVETLEKSDVIFRVYLEVEYRHKETAKKYGCKWDKLKGNWYIEINDVQCAKDKFVFTLFKFDFVTCNKKGYHDEMFDIETECTKSKKNAFMKIY